MGVTKTQGYETEVLQQAVWLKALGHPARIMIVQYLIESSSCIQEDLQDIIPLSEASIRVHVQKLLDAGILNGTEKITTVELTINQQALESVSRFTTMLDEGACEVVRNEV